MIRRNFLKALSLLPFGGLLRPTETVSPVRFPVTMGLPQPPAHPFHPLDLNPAFYYDASQRDGLIRNAEGVIVGMRDLSGNGHHFRLPSQNPETTQISLFIKE